MRRLNAFRLSVNNITRRRGRTVGLILTVALLTIALLGGSLLSESIRRGTESARARLGADALIVPEGYESKAENALLRGEPSAFFLDGNLAERLKAVDGIAKVTPQVFLASFDSPHCSVEVQIIGYDPDTDFVITPWLREELSSPPGYGEIIVGSLIQGNIGQSLTFFDRSYRVAGKLAPTGMGFDSSVFMAGDTFELALADWRKYGNETIPEGAVSSLAVDVVPGMDLNEFARNVRYGFRGESVSVVLTGTLIAGVSSSKGLFKGVISVLIVIIWIIAVFVMALIFKVTLSERKREFGVYRSLGASRKKLSALVLIESALISFTGALLGLSVTALFWFSFSPLIGISVDAPYLNPTAAATVLILAAGTALASVTGPVAAIFSAANVSRVATAAIIKDGE